MAALEQLQSADSTVESVTGGTRIIGGFSKVEKHFSNPDPNRIHLVVQAVPNWCDVCDQALASKKTLNKHKESNAHVIRLARERNAKNPPSDPGSDIEDFHDEGNKYNSSPLITNDLKALNEGTENRSCGDYDGSDVEFDSD